MYRKVVGAYQMLYENCSKAFTLHILYYHEFTCHSIILETLGEDWKRYICWFE